MTARIDHVESPAPVQVGDRLHNGLIYSRLIERSCDAGYDYYHLGESGDNPRLGAFNRRLGAVGYSMPSTSSSVSLS